MNAPAYTIVFQFLAMIFLIFSVMMMVDALAHHEPFRAILGGVLVFANLAIMVVNGRIREKHRGIGNSG